MLQSCVAVTSRDLESYVYNAGVRGEGGGGGGEGETAVQTVD